MASANIFRDRKKLNKVLLILYVALMVAAPLVIILIGFDLVIQDIFKSAFIKNTGYILFLVVSAPAYGYYAFLMIKEHFPAKNKNALFLFIPILFAVVVYFFSGSKNLFEKLMSDSLPLYLGLNIMFFIGLVILFIKNLKGERDIWFRLLFIPVILFVLFLPVYCMLIAGYELSIKYSISEIEILKELLTFFIAIALVIIFHYKTLIGMYKKNAL